MHLKSVTVTMLIEWTEHQKAQRRKEKHEQKGKIFDAVSIIPFSADVAVSYRGNQA